MLGRADHPPQQLCVLDKDPDDGMTLVRRQTIALGDWRGGGRVSVNFPNAALGTNFTRVHAGTDR